MGLFDSVYVDCPHCSSKVEIQCEGDEMMNSYSLETAPDYILRQIMDGVPSHCETCDKWLLVHDPTQPIGKPPRPQTTVLKIKTPPDLPPPHSQGMRWWPNDEPVGPEWVDKD